MTFGSFPFSICSRVTTAKVFDVSEEHTASIYGVYVITSTVISIGVEPGAPNSVS